MKVQLIKTKERAVASERPISTRKEMEQVEERLAIASNVVNDPASGGRRAGGSAVGPPQPESR